MGWGRGRVPLISANTTGETAQDCGEFLCHSVLPECNQGPTQLSNIAVSLWSLHCSFSHLSPLHSTCSLSSTPCIKHKGGNTWEQPVSWLGRGKYLLKSSPASAQLSFCVYLLPLSPWHGASGLFSLLLIRHQGPLQSVRRRKYDQRRFSLLGWHWSINLHWINHCHKFKQEACIFQLPLVGVRTVQRRNHLGKPWVNKMRERCISFFSWDQTVSCFNQMLIGVQRAEAREVHLGNNH